MITYPTVYTPIEDAEVAANAPASEETIRKMVQNMNMLLELCPIGSVQFIQINLQNAPTPNGNILQIMNGGEITNSESPLKSVAPFNRFVPNMTGRYVRAAPNENVIGPRIGGDATVNLSHAHEILPALNGAQCNDGNEVPDYDNFFHTHTSNFDLPSAEPLELSNQHVPAYMRIN